MKKAMILLGVMVAACLLLTGCASRLPESFSEEELERQAQADIERLSAQDFDGMEQRMREDLREILSADALRQALGEGLQSLGGFQSIRDIGFSGTEDAQTGEEYGVVIAVADFEQGTATFTLSYNTDLELVGLYMK